MHKPRNFIKKSVTAATLPALICAGPAFTQTAQIDFTLDPVDATPDICRAALESGKIIRTDDTGTYVISGYHLVRLIIADEKLTCSAAFITNP